MLSKIKFNLFGLTGSIPSGVTQTGLSTPSTTMLIVLSEISPFLVALMTDSNLLDRDTSNALPFIVLSTNRNPGGNTPLITEVVVLLGYINGNSIF